MIAQARITSATGATVHLADQTVDVRGADMDELRTRVKDAFISAARRAGGPIDVVIAEPGARHHLTVEPTGRITGREADDRPVYGPELELLAADGAAPRTPHHAGGRRRASHSAASAASAASAHSATSAHSAASALSAVSANTGSVPAVDTDTQGADPDSHREGSRGADRDASAHNSEPGASHAGHHLRDSAPGTESGASTASADHASGTPRERSSLQPDGTPRPTLQDLQNSARPHREAPPTRGWQGWLARTTGGRVAPRPNRAERREREQLARIRRQLDGPKNIAVVNLKGGAHKTTASLMIAATLGVARGGSVLAWDNNETRGTLGWRGIPSDHHRTALDLLHEVDRLRRPDASVADLDAYVRPQGDMRFDILASDEDAGSAASIDGDAFRLLNDTLSRHYRLKVIDTGNNVRASNWLAAVNTADQLVIISTVREDTFNAAAWMIDELRATGLAAQVDNAVTVLSQPAKGILEPALRKRLVAHFGAHTRAVVEVPFEQQFVDGGHLDWPRVSDATKNAWLEATALIVDGL